MICRASPGTEVNSDDDWRDENWSQEVDFANTKRWTPSTLEELVEVVAFAAEQDKELRAIGTLWSFEDIAKSDGWVVSLDNLANRLDYVVGNGGAALTDFWRDELASPSGRRLVHVEAGIRIAALSEMLDDLELALPTLGGSNGQKLGGAISTSTHGGDWRQPPFPDLVRAMHLVTDKGEEKWIERSSEPLTTPERLTLPCAETEIIRDDSVFDAAIVACGRFGVIYSVVLEVVASFRVVEAITTPTRSEVLQALRDGIAQGTALPFQPLFDLLKKTPSVLDDAKGEPYFFQLLFNSQNPNQVWATRRFITTNTDDFPAARTLTVTGGSDPDLEQARGILTAANGWLLLAALHAGGNPLGGIIAAAYILGVMGEMDDKVRRNGFILWNVAAAAVEALWKIHYRDQVRDLNGQIINGRMDKGGRRGPHYLITSGTRAASDTKSIRSASIEIVFDATTSGYLDFLDQVFANGPSFLQAGYVSLRPSMASRAHLSMHAVSGPRAMSIEIASLKGLSGNEAWMRYVHDLAVARGGRPHWGQYNKLDALDVSMLYGSALNRWREALLRVSGTSMRFSNAFCRARGLEPTAIVREVTTTRKVGKGVISHLCNTAEAWSPVPVAQAIREIQSGTIKYFVKAANRLVAIKVVDGRYLRTVADDTSADNLDNLPPC